MREAEDNARRKERKVAAESADEEWTSLAEAGSEEQKLAAQSEKRRLAAEERKAQVELEKLRRG